MIGFEDYVTFDDVLSICAIEDEEIVDLLEPMNNDFDAKIGARGKIKVRLHRAGAAGKRGTAPLSRGVGINLTFGYGSGSWLRGRQALFMRRTITSVFCLEFRLIQENALPLSSAL
ncbi:hypothetical protein TNCV_3980701 [Trichonephila clavipes]|nr:hypothetical protein TNCV_3980701 [Trichonephila clavipes]